MKKSQQQHTTSVKTSVQRTHFYNHLIEIDSLHVEMETLDLSAPEKEELLSLVDSSIHHVVIDAILSELSQEDKKKFLLHVSQNDHALIWKFLNNKVDNIEDKIKKAAHGLKEKLHADVKEVKRKK